MKQKHIQWIDALKGFGIILVTFAHLSPAVIVETYIYSFHMCLFFFISGYLFRQSASLKSFIAKKAKNILVPFLVWDVLSSLVAIALGDGIQDTILRFFIIKGNLCWNAPIWFLLILFISEVIYATIMKINNSVKTVIAIIIISAILWIIFGSYSVTLKLNLVPFAVFFYAIGDICHRLFDEAAFSAKTVITLIIMGILSIVFSVVLNVRISYTGGYFGNIYFCIIAAVSGTAFYWLIFKHCKYLGNSKLLCTLGKNSLIIMAVQYWFFRAYDIFFEKLLGISIWHERSTVKAVILTAVTISLIMIFVTIFKKIFKNSPKVLNAAKYFGIR